VDHRPFGGVVVVVSPARRFAVGVYFVVCIIRFVAEEKVHFKLCSCVKLKCNVYVRRFGSICCNNGSS
jgi:hypothetical protein